MLKWIKRLFVSEPIVIHYTCVDNWSVPCAQAIRKLKQFSRTIRKMERGALLLLALVLCSPARGADPYSSSDRPYIGSPQYARAMVHAHANNRYRDRQRQLKANKRSLSVNDSYVSQAQRAVAAVRN